MWWPKSKKLMKNGLKINFRIKGFKMIHQLHNVLGFYSLSALVFLSLTGLYFSFHWVRSGLIVALGGEPLEQRSHKKKEQNKPPTADFIAEQAKLKQSAPNIECHLAMVNDVLPYVGKTSVYLPRDAGSGIRVRRYRTDNWLNARLPDAVTFSVSGEIVKVERFNDLPLHRQFRAISRPLHTGELFGTIGCIVYALIALIGASLPLTGFLLWWKKLK